VELGPGGNGKCLEVSAAARLVDEQLREQVCRVDGLSSTAMAICRVMLRLGIRDRVLVLKIEDFLLSQMWGPCSYRAHDVVPSS
jgi:malic enzyme